MTGTPFTATVAVICSIWFMSKDILNPWQLATQTLKLQLCRPAMLTAIVTMAVSAAT